MSDTTVRVLLWSAVTIGVFLAARALHRRWPSRWLAPIIVTPVVVALAMSLLHARYDEYLDGTHWLIAMLGPVTVAFAVPIYEQRALIRAQWRVLLLGMLAGNFTSVVTSWALALLVGLDAELQRSLLPRSITTPFAMSVSGTIGGIPALTAAFAAITGILGALVGDLLLVRLQLKSTLARGALFGVGAHGIGTARAHQVGRGEGAVAGLCMVLAGLMSVLVAPLIALAL
ncbi:MAG: LrgB family protein [Steroidobacteraceae bacterium]